MEVRGVRKRRAGRDGIRERALSCFPRESSALRCGFFRAKPGGRVDGPAKIPELEIEVYAYAAVGDCAHWLTPCYGPAFPYPGGEFSRQDDLGPWVRLKDDRLAQSRQGPCIEDVPAGWSQDQGARRRPEGQALRPDPTHLPLTEPLDNRPRGRGRQDDAARKAPGETIGEHEARRKLGPGRVEACFRRAGDRVRWRQPQGEERKDGVKVEGPTRCLRTPFRSAGGEGRHQECGCGKAKQDPARRPSHGDRGRPPAVSSSGRSVRPA